jgi:predicted AAA+ superfamily ATPase
MLGATDHTLGTLLGKQLRAARRRATALALFRGVLEDGVGQAFVDLLELLDPRPVTDGNDEGHVARPRGSAIATAYSTLFTTLAGRTTPAVGTADAWQSHLIWRVVDDQNPFSTRAERDGRVSLPMSLLDQARRDLRGLQWLYALDAGTIRDATVTLTGSELADALGSWEALAQPPTFDDARLRMARRLSTALDWGAMAEELAVHWQTHGLGLFSRCRAARWSARDGGCLEALNHPDPVKLSDLVAYDSERAPLLRNTARFVDGLPAHHTLLYGERGTGKSSTVKALLQEFGERGLRLVELDKDRLDDLARVLALLRDHPARFIIFVDDLSFEEDEIQYKALKAALEGRIEAWPSNVLLYVTTNRRHLIKERFADRELPNEDEIRPRDTMEEKLSLSDRFGLHVTFPSPDQERYVVIAQTLARAHGITLADSELRKRAIQWALWHNGRSCRSARQFVDDLIGDVS